MTLVRIIKAWTFPNLLRQTPGGDGQWGDIQFTLDTVERCDYVVVLNHLPYETVVDVPPGHIWCMIQEPPLPAFRCFENGFPYYDRIFTQDRTRQGPKFVHTHGSLPWHVGRDYDQLSGATLPTKTRKLAWITSNLGNHKGHRQRLTFLERLRESGVPFDLFGRGFNPIPDKWDGLAPYRYAIAVENCSSVDYWTEKITDCFLAGTMPIYYGAANIADYFPRDSFVWLDITAPDAPRRVAEIIASDLAERNRDAIMEARRRVLDVHNFFPRIAALIQEDLRTHKPSPHRRTELPAIADFSAWTNRSPIERLSQAITRRLKRFARAAT